MTVDRRDRRLGWLLATLLLCGCAGSPAPVYDRSSNPYRKAAPSATRIERPSYHVVQRGETLYAIAWRYGLDFRTLAGWNGIRAPYTIYPEQRLRLSQARGSSSTAVETPAAPVRPDPTPTRPPAATVKPTPRRSAPPKSPPKTTIIDPPVETSPIAWRWPADGAVLSTFLSSDPSRKGLDIAGAAGDPVRAAADGEVVYSGVGLIGYGELIIIKHDAHFLSAYAHNRKRLVNEGDTVKAGQRIAEMGDTGADRVKLHFEIRKDGSPVDPQRHLRPR